MAKKEVIKEKFQKLEPITTNKEWLHYERMLDLNETDNNILFSLLLKYDLNLIEVYQSSKKTIPIHIWGAISQIGNLDDYKSLLSILIDVNNIDTDWLQTDFPKITKIYGIKTLDFIQQIFKNKETDGFYEICLIRSLISLYHIDEVSDSKIQNIIRLFFKNYINELDAEFVNYILKILVQFNTYDFAYLLSELDDEEIINLNDIDPEVLDELFSN